MKTIQQRYLDLIKSAILNELYPELEAQLLYTVLCAAHQQPVQLDLFWQARTDASLRDAVARAKQHGETIHLRLAPGHVRRDQPDLRNYTEYAHSMVGRRRLDHLQQCVEQVLSEGIPGDLLEAGVWRGGCCLLMRAVLAAHDISDRVVWAADSFAGVPKSSHAFDLDYPLDTSVMPVLNVDQATVTDIMRRYGLLDEQIRLLPGWFEQSLPDAGIGQLALLRIDADLYSSTNAVLQALYDKLQPGGWVIIDDYGILPPCRQAVDTFRQQHSIGTPLQQIDDHAVAWRKAAP